VQENVEKAVIVAVLVVWRRPIFGFSSWPGLTRAFKER
jgi:hypothetical protein